MNKQFNKNGIIFQHSVKWKLVDEEWNDQISALTFEDDDGIYMVDIYHAGAGPELEDYVEKHFKCFVEKLPFVSKLVSEPTSSEVTEEGVSGLVLEFVVKSYFFCKTFYINSIFKVVGEGSVSYISAQYPKSQSSVSTPSLKIILSSYRAK